MGQKQTTIVLVAKDLASGNIKRVSQELSHLGTGGQVAAVGLGATMKATSVAETAMGNLKNRVGQLAGSVGMLAGGAGVLGLSGALAQGVSSAMSFQQAMELIATQAGASQQEVDSMTRSVLQMAPALGTDPSSLAAGLYHIESAGIRGAKALDVLQAAAEGAKVGNADLESVTNALVASVSSGVGGITSMTQAMGVLNAIVGSGNMRMQDLTDALASGILSTAKTFGISIQSVGAAIADMTNQGVPAADAATRLRMTISLLGAPSSKATKEFKTLGLSAVDLANAMRGPNGIAGAVELLAEKMRKAGLIDSQGNVNTKGADLLSQAFGGGKSSSAIMTLIGSYAKLNDIQSQITAGAGNFGDAWAKTQEDAAFKFEKFKSAMSVMLIDLGNAALPTLTDTASAIADFITKNQQQISDGMKETIATIRSIGQSLVQVFGTLRTVWDSLPPEFRDLLIKGFVADRASKFLFGMSPLSALTSAGGSAITTALGKLVGGLFGTKGINAAVVNVNAGVVNGAGGAGNLLTGAEEIGGGAATVSAGFVAAVGATLVGILASPAILSTIASTFNPTNSPTSPFGQTFNPNMTRREFYNRPNPAAQNAADAQMTASMNNIWAAKMQAAAAAEQKANAERLAQHAADQAGLKSLGTGYLFGTAKPNEVGASLTYLVDLYKTSKAPSTRSLEQNINALEREEQRFHATGDTVTAQRIASAIAQMQAILSAQLGQLIMSGTANNPGKAKDDITVNVSVSTNAYQNDKAAVTWKRYSSGMAVAQAV